MLKHLFKTCVAVLAIAAAATGPARGQNSYNVTFSGFYSSSLNTTVNVTSLPQTFTSIGGTALAPGAVINGGDGFTAASVTSGGNGMVSVSVSNSSLSITISGPFEGTATIHVAGLNMYGYSVSSDITVSCVAAPAPAPTHTVRLAEGTEDAEHWTITPAAATTTGVQVGSTVTATYSGTRKVKSVKAVMRGAPTITIDGLVLNGQDGDSWTTIVANNPDKIGISVNVIYRLPDGVNLMDGVCGGGSTNPVNGSGSYNASLSNGYHWCGD